MRAPGCLTAKQLLHMKSRSAPEHLHSCAPVITLLNACCLPVCQQLDIHVLVCPPCIDCRDF
jgi:hypothetical protein